MAREMALAGVDKSELTASPTPPQKPKTCKEKLANVWYHHKLAILLGAFFLVLGGMLAFQMLTKNPVDYHVVVVTELPMSAQEFPELEAYFAACGEDIDGDGMVEVEVENLNPNWNAAQTVRHADIQKLNTYIVTGERMLFAFDEVSYDGFFANIAQVTDEDYAFFLPLDVNSPDYDAAQCCWYSGNDKRLAHSALAMRELCFGVRAPMGTASGKDSTQLAEQGKQLLETVITSAP